MVGGIADGDMIRFCSVETMGWCVCWRLAKVCGGEREYLGNARCTLSLGGRGRSKECVDRLGGRVWPSGGCSIMLERPQVAGARRWPIMSGTGARRWMETQRRTTTVDGVGVLVVVVVVVMGKV